MKAYWKKAYSCWYTYSKQVDAATNVMSDYGKRSISRSPPSSSSTSLSPKLEGPLRNSAVARLLVEGRLPVDLSSSSSTNDPVDLSAKPRLPQFTSLPPTTQPIKSEPGEHTNNESIELLQLGMRKEMALLKNVKGPEGYSSSWKCRYCPYSAPTSTTLYSHYQFHQQLLSSQSSKPHQEWLAAYRQAKEGTERQSSPLDNSPSPCGEGSPWPTTPVPSTYPNTPYAGSPTPIPGSAYSLKNLLAKNEDNQQQSASGFLRSIVQAVMQKTPTGTGQSPTSSSIYASLLSQAGAQHQTELGPVTLDGINEAHGNSKLARGKRKCTSPRGSPPPKMAHLEAEAVMDIACERSCSPVLDVVSCDTDIPPVNCVLPELSHQRYRMPESTENIQELSYACSSPLDLPQRLSPTSSGDFSNSPLRPPSELGAGQAELPFSAGTVTPLRNSPSYTSAFIPPRWISPNAVDNIPLGTPQGSSSDSSDEEGSYLEAAVQTKPRRPSVDSAESMISSVSKGISSPVNVATVTSDSNYHSGDYSDTTNSIVGQNTLSSNPHGYEDRSVQCELLLPPNKGEIQEEQVSSESTNGIIKCLHCGITFDDHVMFSIHVGMHSHTDPFVCNLCGRPCGNRYAFYTHIMRGHQNC